MKLQQKKPLIDAIQFRIELHGILQLLTFIIFVSYLVSLLLDTFQRDFVRAFFSPRILLFVALVSGVALIFTRTTPETNGEVKTKSAKKYILIVAVCSILAGLFIFFNLNKITTRPLSILLAVLSSIFLILIGYLVHIEKNDNE